MEAAQYLICVHHEKSEIYLENLCTTHFGLEAPTTISSGLRAFTMIFFFSLNLGKVPSLGALALSLLPTGRGFGELILSTFSSEYVGNAP